MSDKPQYRAWLEGAWRLVLGQRVVTKGKKKGWLEVEYRSSATITRKARIKPEGLKEIVNNV